MSEASLLCLVGILLVFASLHILNGLAWISGKFARIMLGNFLIRSATIPGVPVSTDT